jgi:hypothetical protein
MPRLLPTREHAPVSQSARSGVLAKSGWTRRILQKARGTQAESRHGRLGGEDRRVASANASRRQFPAGFLRGAARTVLYNEIMLLRSEATVIEQLILGIFLIIPLLIVAFLFSDELWQEHRHLHDMRPVDLRHRRIDWRHPLRRSRDRL